MKSDYMERCDRLAWQRKHQVCCKADKVTGACKPIMGDWQTIKPFKDMTYAQRQSYLNRVFKLKSKSAGVAA